MSQLNKESSFDDNSDDVILLPQDSPIKTPKKQNQNQLRSSSNTKLKSPFKSVYRNDLDKPKIKTSTLEPILKNQSLHNQTIPENRTRLSVVTKRIITPLKNNSFNHTFVSPSKRSSNTESHSPTTNKKSNLVRNMKTRAESNHFCISYDLDRITIGTHFCSEFIAPQLFKFDQTEFKFSGLQNHTVTIKSNTFDRFYIHTNPPLICMFFTKRPKNFPNSSLIEVDSSNPDRRRVIFFLERNVKIEDSVISKFKNIFSKYWIESDFNEWITKSVGITEPKSKTPISPSHHDSIISQFIEKDDIDIEHDNTRINHHSSIVEINSSPEIPFLDPISDKQSPEIDVVDSSNSTTQPLTNSYPNISDHDSESDVETDPIQIDHNDSDTNFSTLAKPNPILDDLLTQRTAKSSIFSPRNISPSGSPNHSSTLTPPRRSARIKDRPPSPDFDPELTKWIFDFGSSDNVLTHQFPNNKSITIHGEDLSRLKSEIFLNDTIIEFYSQWILTNRCEELPQLKDEAYIFNTFFYTFIQKGNYERLRKWISKVDLFNKEYIFIPINENLHWYTALICNLSKFDPFKKMDPKNDSPMETTNIYIFDSLKLRHPKTFEHLDQFLLDEYKIRNPEKFENSLIDIEEMKPTIHSYAKVRGQNNFSDCGVYLLYYLKNFFKNPSEQKKLICSNKTIELDSTQSMKEVRREILKLIHTLFLQRDVPGILETVEDSNQLDDDNSNGEDDNDLIITDS